MMLYYDTHIKNCYFQTNKDTRAISDAHNWLKRFICIFFFLVHFVSFNIPMNIIARWWSNKRANAVKGMIRKMFSYLEKCCASDDKIKPITNCVLAAASNVMDTNGRTNIFSIQYTQSFICVRCRFEEKECRHWQQYPFLMNINIRKRNEKRR